MTEIIICSLLWIFVIGIVSIYFNRRIKQLADRLEKNKTDYENKIAVYRDESAVIKNKYEEQINDLKDQNRMDKESEYNRGYHAGMENSRVSLQITPYKEIKTGKHLFGRTEEILIGYKYQLLVNGIPCLNTQTEIIEKINTKELNEGNVKFVIEKLEKVISKLPVPHIQMAGSLIDFGRSIVTMIKNKK